jgi:hypothetical protein
MIIISECRALMIIIYKCLFQNQKTKLLAHGFEEFISIYLIMTDRKIYWNDLYLIIEFTHLS